MDILCIAFAGSLTRISARQVCEHSEGSVGGFIIIA